MQDESQQSLIAAYIKLLKNSVKISLINVKTSGYVHYINYYLKILNSMHKIHKTWRQAKITWENGSQDSSKPEVYHNSKNGKTFIVGDLNSRTGLLDDILETDKYLDENLNDEQNDNFENILINETVFPKRNNSDHVTDTNGKNLISLCKATDHIIQGCPSVAFSHFFAN